MDTNKPSARFPFSQVRDCETMQNRITRGLNRYGTAENSNPHAVALGQMTSTAKKAAAQKNGEKGGRPVGS
jgi:hypothetical protein